MTAPLAPPPWEAVIEQDPNFRISMEVPFTLIVQTEEVKEARFTDSPVAVFESFFDTAFEAIVTGKVATTVSPGFGNEIFWIARELTTIVRVFAGAGE